MTRTIPLNLPWKTIRKKFPYEGRMCQGDGWKTAYGPARNAYSPAKTMRKNFVATKCFLENEWKRTLSSIIPANCRTSKCCNYLLTMKQQKESHYSRIKKIRNLLRANKCYMIYDKILIDWVRSEQTWSVPEHIWLWVRTHRPWAKYFPSGPPT